MPYLSASIVQTMFASGTTKPLTMPSRATSGSKRQADQPTGTGMAP
jgi:hypothetical protein